MNPRTLSAVYRIGRKMADLQVCSPSMMTAISVEIDSGNVPSSSRRRVGDIG